MKPAALLAFISDIHALTLQTAQGLYLTTGWYWDLNDETRAFGKRFFAKTNKEPTMDQAGVLLGHYAVFEGGQGGEIHRSRLGDGGTQENQDQRYVRQERLRTRRWLDGTHHVRHESKDSGRIKISLGLLQAGRSVPGEEADGVATRSACVMPKK
jgi:branched-chain amino acid transport system substrate-binding protein